MSRPIKFSDFDIVALFKPSYSRITCRALLSTLDPLLNPPGGLTAFEGDLTEMGSLLERGFNLFSEDGSISSQ